MGTMKPDPLTWEARMAERTRQRRCVVERAAAEQKAVWEAAAQRPWLNGWPRIGNGVLMGTSVHCVCCGRCQGITCVVFSEDWEPPGPDPVWPFTEDDCPLCVDLSS